MTAQLVSWITPESTAPGAATAGGPADNAWHRLRMAIDEMNYAARRLADLRIERPTGTGA